MTVFRVAALAASMSLACLPSMAQASACWYPEEARAAQVRGLQTMLMVGTLRCRHHSRASEYLYTDFIDNQRGTLDANNAILKARFERESGYARGQGAYDRFATALANQYSEQLAEPGFCTTVHHYARQAAYADSRELLRLADAVAEPPRTDRCRPADDMVAAGAGQDHYDRGAHRGPPPPRVAVADPGAPFGEATAPVPAEPVIVAEAGADKLERVMEVAQAPAPATVQPAAQVEGPAAADRDEALKTALLALESALAALQAATAAMPEPAAPVAAVEPVGAVEVDAGAADPGVATNTYVPAAETRR